MSIQDVAPQRSNVIVDPRRDVPIEPVGQPETPKPFTPGAGTWIAAGSAGVISGLFSGAMVGAMTITNGATGMGKVLGIGAAIGAGLLVAAGGGLLAYNMSKGGHQDREQKRVTDAFGTSTLLNARELFTRFDHDGDGKIDLDRVSETGLEGTDERVFREKREQSDSNLEYDWWDDDWDIETTRWNESRGVSAAPLWTEANADPKDNVVTDVELAQVMARYDADRSGTLNATERDAFTATNPFIYEEWRK